MKKIIIMLALCNFFLMSSAMAMDKMSEGHAMKEGSATMDQSKMESMDHSKMDHGAMANDSGQMGGMFKKTVTVDGIKAEFEIMDLASMKMTDPEGHTHHVMVTFMNNNEKITQVVGKIKIISPSGKEQLADLKDFGNGVFAATVSFDEKGKWGVICLFKDADGKHIAKFWYDNDMK